MSDRVRQWPVLTPAGHASIDQTFISAQTLRWPDSKPFHHSGSKAFEQRVGIRAQTKHKFDTVRMLQIDRDRRPASIHQIVFRRQGNTEIRVGQAVYANDPGAHVGEQHAAKLARTNAGNFYDFEALERAHDFDPASFFRNTGLQGTTELPSVHFYGAAGHVAAGV